ncbi:MAG: hypothetical protein ABJC63_11080 [Gemmatimonadales bacterium]
MNLLALPTNHMATSTESIVEVPSLPAGAHANSVRWLFFGVSVALLSLLLMSGILDARFLATLHTQELAATHLLAERGQMLSGLWLSVQNYNQAVEQLVAETKAEQWRAASQQLDRLTLEVDSDLKRYPLDRDPAESALLDELQGVFAEQRTLYVAVISARPENRQRAQSLLAKHMAPVRKQILDGPGSSKTGMGTGFSTPMRPW